MPHALEARAVTAGGCAAKAAWVSCQLLFYALRPLVIRPKAPGKWDALNWATVLAFDAAVLAAPGFGPKALAYLLLSSLLGGGAHPAAGHFIAEARDALMRGVSVLFRLTRRFKRAALHVRRERRQAGDVQLVRGIERTRRLVLFPS